MNGIEFFNVKYLCVYVNEDYRKRFQYVHGRG